MVSGEKDENGEQGETIVIARKRRGLRAALTLTLAASFLCLSSFQSVASTETLKRSVSNILQGPLDLVLAPMTAAKGITTKMIDSEDSNWVRAIFVAPGYIWYTGVIVGAGVLRVVTGGLELVPGILLMPFEADLDPLFDPVDRAPALVEFDTPCCINIRFGIDYTNPEY